MKISDILLESRGFAARNPGDSFVNPTNPNDTVTFNEILTLPVNGFRYDDVETRDVGFNKWLKSLSKDAKVYYINKPTNKLLGIMIIHMTVAGKKKEIDEYYVNYVMDVANLKGKLSSIPPNVKEPGHGGYIYNTARSLSENYTIKPSQVLSSPGPYKITAIAGLLEIAKDTAPVDLVEMMQEYITQLVSTGKASQLIPGGGQYMSAIQKYLGEWAAPIALIKGDFQPVGLQKKIEDNVLAGQSFKRAVVKYPISANESLFDSSVGINEDELYLSSKTGKGAAASLKGLYDTYMKNKDVFTKKARKDPKFAKFLDIITIIAENPQVQGLLILAKKERIISAADEKNIIDLLRSQKKGPIAKDEAGIVNKIMAGKAGKVVTEKSLTERLQNYMRLKQTDYTNKHYNPVYHAIAAVGRFLTDKLNKEDFTDSVKEILNHANFAQVYFNAVQKGEDVQVQGFKVVWPPTFDGRIAFDAGKNFSSTEIKGKLGFKIT